MRRFYRVGMAAGFLLLSLASGYSQAPNANSLLEEAVRLHNAGNLQQAVNKYEEVLAIHPDQPAVRSNLGAALVRLGRHGDAIVQYRKALEQHNANPGIRFNLALAYYKTGGIDLARKELETVVPADPGNQNAKLILADCYLQAGESKRVIDLLAPLESETPNDFALAYLLGTALIREEQTEKGQALIDKILKNGDSAEAHLMLGTAHLLVNDYPGAVKEFGQAVKLNPKLPGVHSYYASALDEMGESDKAMEAYKLELEVNPYDFHANLYLGVDYFKQDQNYEAALACFERALRVRPHADEVRFQIAIVYLAQGRTEEARVLLEELIKRAPDFLEAHVALATLYYRMKRREDAERHRAIAEKLRAERQAEARVPGGQEQSPPAPTEVHPPQGEPK